ncbi:MAG TPA: PAS domain S-box protein [Gaiellaceae bacterium]|nr:PAS domain S-box protein [Gaiellaceae bacterium]
MGVADALIQTSLLGEAVDNGPAAVFVADENRRYIAVSKAACELLGYTREELLALRVDDVAENVPGWTEMEQSRTVLGEAELKRRDGSKVTFRYVAGDTIVAGMPVFVSVGIPG